MNGRHTSGPVASQTRQKRGTNSGQHATRTSEKNLFNCLGSKLKTLTEQEMMDEIKKLAVLAQNNLVKMVQFFELSQDREEPIRAFFARLKAAASACKLTVQCTAVNCTKRVSYSDNATMRLCACAQSRKSDRHTCLLFTLSPSRVK